MRPVQSFLTAATTIASPTAAPDGPIIVCRFAVTVWREDRLLEQRDRIFGRPELLLSLADGFAGERRAHAAFAALDATHVRTDLRLHDGQLLVDVQATFAGTPARPADVEAAAETFWAEPHPWDALLGYAPDFERAELAFEHVESWQTAAAPPAVEWRIPDAPFAPEAQALEAGGQIAEARTAYNSALDARLDGAEFAHLHARWVADALIRDGAPLGAAIALDRATFLCWEPVEAERYRLATAAALSAAGEHLDALALAKRLVDQKFSLLRRAPREALGPLLALARVQAAAGDVFDAVRTFDRLERIGRRRLGAEHPWMLSAAAERAGIEAGATPAPAG